MIKGGALYYAIFISFVGSLLCGLLILSVSLSRQIVQNDIGRDDLQMNVRSGLTLALQEPALIPYNDSLEYILFKDQTSKVTFYKRHWGMYDIISVTSSWKKYKSALMALVGQDLKISNAPALYLAENSRYLSLSGDTRIKGTAYLPALGVKQAHIEGKNYSGQKIIYGEIKQSRRALPDINPEIVSYVHEMLSNKGLASSGMVHIASSSTNINIENSHGNFPLILYNNQKDLVLDNITLAGNVIIVSGGLVEIYPGARMEGILIFCRKAGIADNYKGNFQLFASDSIIAGDNVSLDYPSVLACFNTDANPSYLYVGKNSVIDGGLIIHDSGKSSTGSQLILENGSQISGQVYCTGSIEHRGKVYGQMYCKGFHLKTSRAYYENHLLDAVISLDDLPGEFTGTAMIEDKHYRPVQWLN